MGSEHSPEGIPQSLEGRELHPSTADELKEAMTSIVDYRGDVTLILKSGNHVVGYAFDREERMGVLCVRMYVQGQVEAQKVKYQDVEKIVFSGEDTAFGRSWEDWAKKWKNSDPKKENDP